MFCSIAKSNLVGVIKCPASKSYTHRAIFLASLAKGKSIIYDPLFSADTRSTISACKGFGADISIRDDLLEITGTLEIKPAKIDAANSGTTMRIATAVASLIDGTSTLYGDASLSKRPMKALLESLSKMGAKIDAYDNMPPITIHGIIEGGNVTIRGDVSSQYVSALLMAGSMSKNGIVVDIDGSLVSKDYVAYTIETMKRFGVLVKRTDLGYSCDRQRYVATKFTVPFDTSILALLVVAKILFGERLEIDIGRSKDGPSESSHIIEICSKMGISICFENERCIVENSKSADTQIIDLIDQPDLFPAMAVLALKGSKKTIITGIGHTKYKETDRITVISTELAKTGAIITKTDDSLTIECTQRLKPAKFDARGDHRLFMAFCLAGMYIGECTVTDPESVAISYPDFIKDICTVGGKIKL
ncbi:MAG: 3-phosphoshikimate 1-carboxyvinyltransferase [Cenarchaeum symbiont of Oopsacas minuta]|nr:3-phosphoshikimate 1-carboxyvinyltransferase [Cenarchaeum symbiont of Oopsacas minuta]